MLDELIRREFNRWAEQGRGRGMEKRHWEITRQMIELIPDPGPGTRGRFDARLLVPGPLVDGARLTGFHGRWLVADGLVLTTVTVPHR